MTEIYLHFLFAHYGLIVHAPVSGTAGEEGEQKQQEEEEEEAGCLGGASPTHLSAM